VVSSLQVFLPKFLHHSVFVQHKGARPFVPTCRREGAAQSRLWGGGEDGGSMHLTGSVEWATTRQLSLRIILVSSLFRRIVYFYGLLRRSDYCGRSASVFPVHCHLSSAVDTVSLKLPRKLGILPFVLKYGYWMKAGTQWAFVSRKAPLVPIRDRRRKTQKN
jgi:hypothetical protein